MSGETQSDLMQLKVADLKKLCKERDLPTTGNKAELVETLLGNHKSLKSKKMAKAERSMLGKKVFQTLLRDDKQRSPILIKRNIHGNFEHVETKLVFSMDKKVIGIQKDSGEIGSLTIKDLESVHKYHFEIASGVNVEDEQTSALMISDESKEERIASLIEMTEFTTA